VAHTILYSDPYVFLSHPQRKRAIGAGLKMVFSDHMLALDCHSLQTCLIIELLKFFSLSDLVESLMVRFGR
jgi:hypothetical protein